MAHQHRHFSGDPFALSGFWSPSTSSANFCEEDYAVTRYIAEFINSLSSLTYTYLALRPPGSPQNGHPRILDPFSIALFAVGIASMVYHATLRQGPQFGDDLSMLFLGGSLLQTLYSRGQTRTTTTLVTTVTAVGTLGASAMYIRSGNIFHHFAAFSTMVHLIWPRTLYLILSAERPQTERTALLRGFWKAAALLVAAFVLWNIDLEICFELRELRARIGLPWVWLLELHGWWHVLTAFGAAEYIALVRVL